MSTTPVDPLDAYLAKAAEQEPVCLEALRNLRAEWGDETEQRLAIARAEARRMYDAQCRKQKKKSYKEDFVAWLEEGWRGNDVEFVKRLYEMAVTRKS